MSFKFDEDVFKDNSFNEKIKEKLTSALNKAFNSDDKQNNSGSDPYNLNHTNKHSEKSDILRSKIIVKRADFPTIPKFEILDLDINIQPRSLVKGICKIIVKDATVQLQTVIESNLLLVNMKNSPNFIKPKLIENNSLEIPIVMTFKEISLEAISNIFVKNNSISISFNDVNLDFNFNCSIKILQATIEKRLKDSMHLVFKDVLPTVLFNMSQSWFTNNHNQNSNHNQNTTNDITNQSSLPPKTVFDETDLLELSPKNMLRLSTIVSSRHTLSLHGTTGLNSMASISGCLEKQNLYRFISRMPSLSNYYAAYSKSNNTEKEVEFSNNNNSNSVLDQKLRMQNFQYSNDENILPERVLTEKKYDLNKIIEIQNKLYERSTVDENEKPKRRTIKLKRKQKTKKETPVEVRQSTPTFEKINIPMHPIMEKPINAIITPSELDQTPENILSNEKCDYFTHDASALFRSINDDINSNEINDIKLRRRLSSVGSIAKSISFVGINNHYNNNGWKWGNEDNTTLLPPPPYRL